MFRRKEVMYALAAKNVTASELKKEQKILTELQEQITKAEQEQKQLKKATAANNKKVGLYCARIKSQYMKLESKTEEPAEGFMRWAADSPILNVQTYHREIKQIKKENNKHEHKINALQHSITHLSVQTALKQIIVENLQQELVSRNEVIQSLFPPSDDRNVKYVNGRVKTTKGSLEEIKKERDKRSGPTQS